MKYYLAVDIGASSGRLILSHMEDGKIVLEEIHRFENGMEEKDGHLIWNTDGLFAEILTGMRKCRELGKIPKNIGIDTWAVDYVLLDKEGNKIGQTYGYRDCRTEGMDERVYRIIDEKLLYAKTGIQKQPFNTIYQLMATKVLTKEVYEKAETMLLIPDYLHYLLCGEKVTEYTNASTTQLLNPLTKDWDFDLIDSLGYKRDLFCKIALPGEKIGKIKKDVEYAVGFSCDVVIPATHDTASAVMAVPSASDNTLYISSGTWSLIGTELKEAICTEESRKCNFTNEGGYDYRFRYLKNIMGMWMINSVRKELAPHMRFDKICEGASKQTINSLIDANSKRFLAPDSMTEEIKRACEESKQQVPDTIEEFAAVIYNSLAKCYALAVDEIEQITGKHFEAIHIIGGGAKADYLNSLTAKACKRLVLAGPVEATAIGNVVSQMIADKALSSLEEARECIYKSFDIKEFKKSEDKEC